MRIGFVGCGKLGLMVALSIESKGHEVKGYDIDTRIAGYLNSKRIPFKEENSARLLANTKMQMVPLQELCDWADIIFMAPQTPHEEKYEGHKPLPSTRADFNYMFLRECVGQVGNALKTPKTCVLISTVLPGTLDREVLPYLAPNVLFVYEPLFIAMGTVRKDFLNPEFVLVGVNEPGPADELEAFYKTIHDKPIFRTDIRTAEGIKVFYNTFITAKTVLANLYGEMSHRLGMNVDDITKALSMATDRLISPKYLDAGMGDGGGCHPRDNIALSFIARRENLSFDFFETLMIAREKHAEFLADLVEENRGNLPIYILGKSFKPETNIETGSPAVLLSEILHKRGVAHSIDDDYIPSWKGLFFIGTKHKRFATWKFPAGSVVIDPFRYIPADPGIELVSIGSGQRVRVLA